MVPGHPRCEGFFERSVSQPFIELVSLTRGPWPAAGAGTGSLLDIYADVRMPLRLVVQPQRSGPFYRVDAALQGGQALSWDPAPMLAATGLRPADLGFVALAGSARPSAAAVTSVVPVALSEQGRQAMRVDAVVRVSVAVSSVAWRAYRLGAAAGSMPGWTKAPDSQLYAWQRITLPIDLPSDGNGLHVDVQALGASDGRMLPLLRFAIVGPRDVSPVR
jgi:hypothetical protein